MPDPSGLTLNAKVLGWLCLRGAVRGDSLNRSCHFECTAKAVCGSVGPPCGAGIEM